MPIYGFQLDVPAPPEVVEERVRAVVGKAPTFWEGLASSWRGPQQPGFAFLGTVGGRSFLIRRAIQYRNSFLPLIRGKIVATPAGSRVNVLMFMHPASLIFMLLWFGFLISTESRLLNANIARSYIPIGMIIFGLVLSLGGFFFEALKVMPLLSAAVFNPAITTTVPGPAAESQPLATNSPPVPENSLVRIAVPVGAAIVLLAAFALVNRYENWLRSCPAFGAALDLASKSDAVRAALGGPVKAGVAARGMIHENTESGYAAMAIPVSGPAADAKGTLYIVANRTAGRWDIERAALHVGDGPAPYSSPSD